MKIMRYFPLIALAILGFIGYSLYKTSSFINKTVNSETLLTQDSLVQHQNDVNPLASDTTSFTAVIPVEPSSVTVTAAPTASGTTQTPTETVATTTPVETSIALTTPPTTTSKTKEAVSQAKKESAKEPVKGSKSATKKTTSTKKDSAAMQPNAETFKAANALEKKPAADTRYHVIIGTFKSEANAKTHALKFEQKNHKKAVVLKNGGYYRVSADDFEFQQAASQYALKLREAGEDNIVLKF